MKILNNFSIFTQNNMGDNMYTSSMVCVHVIAVGALMAAATYIYLNETGKLDRVKSQCYNKMMDLKDELKNKLD